jgi:hypothetical protein
MIGLVCYFCNPFDTTLMTQMVPKIRNSILRTPREIFILYYNAEEGHVFDQADCFQKVEANGWIRIWRSMLLVSKQTKESALC